MKSKILTFLFASMLITLLSVSCDFYYNDDNFYINYVEVDDSPVFVLPSGGNINVRASIGNSEWFINCYYQIIASNDKYYSYNDKILYTSDVYIGSHSETINKTISIDSSIPDGFYYVGIRIRNSVYESVKFTDRIAFHKNDGGTMPANLTIQNQSEFNAQISMNGYELFDLSSQNSKTLNNVPTGTHTLSADLEKFNVFYTYGPDNINLTSFGTSWVINNTQTGTIFVDNTTQYDAKIYINNILWGTVSRYDYAQIDHCLPGYYTLSATSIDGNCSWQDNSFHLYANDFESWTLGNPPSGTITVFNDSYEDIDVFIDNQFAGSIYAGKTLNVNNILYGSRKLYAEARYSSNYWGPKVINFNGSYFWTISNSTQQSDITVNNYTSEAIDVYIDGFYKGTLYSYDVFTVRNVGEGTHRLYAESYYSAWGPRWISLNPGESYTWELWP